MSETQRVLAGFRQIDIVN